MKKKRFTPCVPRSEVLPNSLLRWRIKRQPRGCCVTGTDPRSLKARSRSLRGSARSTREQYWGRRFRLFPKGSRIPSRETSLELPNLLAQHSTALQAKIRQKFCQETISERRGLSEINGSGGTFSVSLNPSAPVREGGRRNESPSLTRRVIGR